MALVYLMTDAPKRPPFSDWLAQVERIAFRLSGFEMRCRSDSLTDVWHSYYYAGVSPRECADDLCDER